MRLGDRQYRVRGLDRNFSPTSLRVTVHVQRGESFHVDTLDLYAARQRSAFVKLAASELGVREEVVKLDLGKVLSVVEERRDAQLKAMLAQPAAPRAMPEAEESEALAFLRDPGLLERIVADLERCGLVGERTNKLLGYLAAISRKLREPLALVIQSTSAAGKTSLMDAVLAFVPDEDKVRYSALTGRALFYMGTQEIRHKVLAVAEDQGAQRATYALKLLQSEHELTLASTGKDGSGRMVAEEYKVEGPVALFLTTTAVQLDEELLNRCLVLTVDEDREQTRAIHRLQRERQTLEGQLLAKGAREAIVKLHQNAQRLLRPLVVVNPHARELTFLDHRTRTRRDHLKYLALINAVALLHQHQRETKTAGEVEYIEVTPGDIAMANQLAGQALGRSLDEVPPHTRRLLVALDEMVREASQRRGVRREQCRFTQREIRERTGWGNTQVKVHLRRLVDLEYLLAVRTRGSGRFEYEVLFDGSGAAGEPFLPGLVDPERLRKDNRSGSGRGGVGPGSGLGRTAMSEEKVYRDESLRPGWSEGRPDVKGSED